MGVDTEELPDAEPDEAPTPPGGGVSGGGVSGGGGLAGGWHRLGTTPLARVGRVVQASVLVAASVIAVRQCTSPSGDRGTGGIPVTVDDPTALPKLELPQLVAADDFERADGAGLEGGSATWTLTGSGWRVVSGAARHDMTQLAGDSEALLAAPSAARTVFQARVSDSTDGAGVTFRHRDAGNNWRLVAFPSFSAWALELVQGGVVKQVRQWAPVTGAEGSTVTVELSGSKMRFWLAGKSLGEVSDPTLADEAGVGLVGQLGAAGAWDDVRLYAGS